MTACRIPIKGGAFALVDPEWFDVLSRHKWSLAGNDTRKYARARAGYMHRIVAAAPPDKVVDHINGDPLDNRAENLRVCDMGQNLANSKRAPGRSAYRGVTKKRNQWRARINRHGREETIGTFATAEAAAAAYNKRALEIYGDFATLNQVVAEPTTYRDQLPRTCKKCGSEFAIHPVGRPRLYCSNSCKGSSR